MSTRPLLALGDRARLAGTLWLPLGAPRALVIMHPGSGPSDRDNDVLFPPIREALLGLDVAVCSFDKRGVGGSSGAWQDAGIDVQARDLLAGLAAARAVLGELPTGLFGHSQGGWVVLEAAAEAAPDFVITNSGPAVSPREQETYSTLRSLQRHGGDDESVRAGMAGFAAAMDLLASPFETGWPRVRALPTMAELVAAGAFIPDDPEVWSFAARIMDHEPRPALRALAVPLLALYGEDDDVVPVARCVEVLRATVRPSLLELSILSGGDHRVQDGDGFVDGYLEALTRYVDRAVRRGSRHDEDLRDDPRGGV